MPRYLFLTLLCLAPSAHAAPPTNDHAAHDLAYSLGASLGGRLREEVPDLQLEALIDGLRGAYQGQPLALTDAQIAQVLAQHQAHIDDAVVQPDTEKALTAERAYLREEKNKPGVRELAPGILLSELKPGTGVKTSAQGAVYVNYIGRLPDGTVFDHSVQPQWFRLDSVIEGWRSALVQMPVGAKWRLVIASSLAYGAQGAEGVIAPYTPLEFDIELLAVKP